MFDAVNLALDGDHLDLSFERSDGWTRVGPAPGMPPSQWIKLGDPTTGPTIQLGLCGAVPESMWLDTHYHASDQLRVALQGDFQLQRKHMKAGDFGFQAAGIPYREGLVGGSTEELWMFAVHGSWRGARSTNTRSDGTFLLGEVAEDQLDREVAADAADYWADVPGGDRGIAALATTGKVRGGFSWGNFADTADWDRLADRVAASGGLLGDRSSGPAVMLLSAATAGEIVPACVADTELVLVVVRGACRIGDMIYRRGMVRVQREGVALDGVNALEDGADVVLLVADRRAMPAPPEGHARGWFDAAEALVARLDRTLG